MSQDTPPDEAGGGTLLQGGVSADAPATGDVFSSNGSGGGGGDEFNSNGYDTGPAGDVFSSNGGGDGPGDVFSSNGGDGGVVRPKKIPCGMNPLQAEAWTGAASATFLDMLSTVIPDCSEIFASQGGRQRRAPPDQPPVAPPPEKIVFHWFYINGINTRTGESDAETRRGTCMFERAIVKQNLLDLPVTTGYPAGDLKTPLKTPPPLAASRSRIKVGDETDVMEPPSCNPSGTEPLYSKLIGTCGMLPDQMFGGFPPGKAEACRRIDGTLALIDEFRRSGFIVGMAPGDLYQCFQQSVNLQQCSAVAGAAASMCLAGSPFSTALAPVFGLLADKVVNDQGQKLNFDIEGTRNDPLVVDVANRIMSIYRQEGGQRYASRTIHFFVVVTHSQGNFFGEGIAYRLYRSMDPDESYVFANRLGIVSLASPTDFSTLPERFRRERIAHSTRIDDGIKMLSAISAIGKSPWAEDKDPPLWPWKAEALRNLLYSGNPIQTLIQAGAAFSTGGLAGSEYDLSDGEVDDALQTPLMNSHLVENYLTDPTASRPCRAVKGTIAREQLNVDPTYIAGYCARMMPPPKPLPPDTAYSPVGQPIVKTVRERVWRLKANLMANLYADLGYLR